MFSDGVLLPTLLHHCKLAYCYCVLAGLTMTYLPLDERLTTVGDDLDPVSCLISFRTWDARST